MKTALSILLALAGMLGMSTSEAAEVGKPAPSFSLTDQYGEEHALEDFAGKWLVVFFYPKADTPGCTTQACNFRDNIYAVRGAGAEVVGISIDTVADQRAFSDKYRLPFTILSDSEGVACRDYGVLRSFGEMDIASRESFLIDPNGVVVKHYQRVNPETHTQEVIADLERLQSNEVQSAAG